LFDVVLRVQWILNRLINTAQVELLNGSETSHVQNLFKDTDAVVETDADEQLIFSVEMTQPIKLHSVRIKAPSDGRAPMTVKLYINQATTPV
jgi:hypothetical protein